MIHVRALTGSDRLDVVRINAAGRPGVAPLDELEFSRLLALSNLHVGATDNIGRLTGYALAFDRESCYEGEEFRAFRQKISRGFVYVDQIAVELSARRTGAGRSMYAALEEAADLRGMSSLCCEVNTRPANPHSLAFHERLGFRSVGSLETSDGRQVRLLVKAITRQHGSTP